jgi:hypothetical protein
MGVVAVAACKVPVEPPVFLKCVVVLEVGEAAGIM